MGVSNTVRDKRPREETSQERTLPPSEHIEDQGTDSCSEQMGTVDTPTRNKRSREETSQERTLPPSKRKAWTCTIPSDPLTLILDSLSPQDLFKLRRVSTGTRNDVERHIENLLEHPQLWIGSESIFTVLQCSLFEARKSSSEEQVALVKRVIEQLESCPEAFKWTNDGTTPTQAWVCGWVAAGLVHDPKILNKETVTEFKKAQEKCRPQSGTPITDDVAMFVWDHDLDLGYNKLVSLPGSFGWMTVGGNLVLDGNDLVSLPESFGWLTVGGNLGLSDNELVSLPESFARLTVGRDLYLDNNRLKSLPENFGQLKVGGSLYLGGNYLESVPKSFAQLKVGGDLYLDIDQFFGNVKGEVHYQ